MTDAYNEGNLENQRNLNHAIYKFKPSIIIHLAAQAGVRYSIQNPQVYPTTIGMYNDANELLAVAKLSRPIQKDFTKEALIRVKLDF